MRGWWGMDWDGDWVDGERGGITRIGNLGCARIMLCDIYPVLRTLFVGVFGNFFFGMGL